MTTEVTEMYDLMEKALKAIDALNDESDLGVYSLRVGIILAAYHEKEAEIRGKYE